MRSTRIPSAIAAACAAALIAAPAAAGNVKVSGLPPASPVSATDVFPATQGTCPSSCATNGVTGAQLKTFVTTAPAVTTIGGLNPVSSITAGATAQIGAGGTVVCAASHVCDSVSGELTVTTGTGSFSAGTIFTVNFADTRTHIPNCAVGSFGIGSGGTSVNSRTLTETTSSLAVQSTLAASTTYAIDYVCMGD